MILFSKKNYLSPFKFNISLIAFLKNNKILLVINFIEKMIKITSKISTSKISLI